MNDDHSATTISAFERAMGAAMALTRDLEADAARGDVAPHVAITVGEADHEARDPDAR